MGTTAQQIVNIARGWLGAKQGDATHKAIVDLYNTQNPRPRGYKVSYTDAWCATFVTAVFMKAGALDLIYGECGCESMINGMKSKGIWIENENRKPNVGDIVFYDWQDTTGSNGDDKGSSDHVGIVESVSGNTFVVIEGNYSTQKCVARRTVTVNQRYLRGFAVPKYDTVTAQSTPAPTKTTTTTTKSIEDVAKEVIAGKWGSGDARKQKLTAAGYNYAEVQNKVNSLLSVKTTTTTTAPAKPASTTKQGKVTAKSGLNIRYSASISARKLGAIPCGQTVTIIDSSNSNWYKVNWKGIIGYCSSNYIKLF